MKTVSRGITTTLILGVLFVILSSCSSNTNGSSSTATSPTSRPVRSYTSQSSSSYSGTTQSSSQSSSTNQLPVVKQKSLIGIWDRQNESWSYEFKADGTFISRDNGLAFPGTYTLNNYSLTIIVPSFYKTFYYSVKIEGDIMTLYSDSSSEGDTYKRR